MFLSDQRNVHPARALQRALYVRPKSLAEITFIASIFKLLYFVWIAEVTILKSALENEKQLLGMHCVIES
jgi:hypothetical protein